MSYTVYRRQVGVDVSADRLSLPNEYASWGINRSFRGGRDDTRPPFIAYHNIFPSEEDELRIRKGNVSGMFGYNSLGGVYQTHIILAVADCIYKARIYGRTLEWSLLYRGISAQFQMSFFVQAENLLIWQNGIDLPLYWDGLSPTMAYCKDAEGITAPMPVGNIMVYAHGRIFLATESNIVKVSKHLYSIGLGNTNGVLDFGESEYWSDGDGFGATANLGQITGMGVIKRNSETNGHGPVIVFQQRGAFAINPTIPRPEWITDPNVQQIVITGRGCSSPYSVVGVNGDLWFRCTDKTIASFKNEASRQDSWNDTALSKEVNKFTDLDSGESLRFSFSAYTGNRLLVSVGSRSEKSDDYGYHRYCLGIVSLDFDDGSSVIKDQPFSWDGLWTGIRPTGVAEIMLGQQITSVYGSFDHDNTNRFYFLASYSGGNDIGENGESRIQWQRVNEGALYSQQEPAISTLKSTRVEYFNAVGKTEIRQSFKPDDYPCFAEFPEADVMPEPACPELQECGSLINSRPLSGHLNFMYNCVDPQINTNRPMNKGASFSIRTTGTGAVSIRSIIVFGDTTQLPHPEPQSCSNQPIDCCFYDDNYLSYLIK